MAASCTIPLFPLGNALFPDGIMHLRVFEVRYLDMIRKCIANGSSFGVVPLLAGREVRTPQGHEVLADAGTLARIVESSAPMPGLLQVVCLGTRRFRLLSAREGKYGLWQGEAEILDDDEPVPIPAPLQAGADALGALIADLQQRGTPPALMPLSPPFRLDECGWVADRWSELLPLSMAEKAELLLMPDPGQRLARIHEALAQRGLLPDPPDDAQDP
ncbi:LON peptidase substrate-binding domain-containing protein [Bordetella genomosp. 9]|uniref:Peptidase S16 n=1 Tax=Bordetella genomosp. 9 TaxID=1416803 RepID=A0A1W6Z1V0_9BORD|nr:LON peptidase substrate-binding domain-containing protein [Bordetella genomosp. 9]ARP87231.1 peptidase S16 [Bordetella genomosp. 9]